MLFVTSPQSLQKATIRMSLCTPAFILTTTSLPVPAAYRSPQHNVGPTMLHYSDGVGIQARELNLCFIRSDHFSLWLPFCELWECRRAIFLKSGFHLDTIIKAWLMECCRNVVLLKGSPLSTGQCWSSGWEVTKDWWSLWQRPTDCSNWLGVYEESRCFKLLPFMDYWGCWAHWDLQSCRNVSVRFPRSAPRYNPVLEVYRQLWDLIQTSVGGVQSTEFTTGRLQTSCRNIWQMTGGNQMHLSSVLQVVIKAVNT